MHLEYEHNTDKEAARIKIDSYIQKINHMKLPGNFQILDLTKSWKGDDMQFSFVLKSSILERNTTGVIQLDDKKIVLEAEIPTITKNFIKDENLEAMIKKHIAIALES